MGVAAAPSPLRRQRLKRQDSYGNEQRATSNEQRATSKRRQVSWSLHFQEASRQVPQTCRANNDAATTVRILRKPSIPAGSLDPRQLSNQRTSRCPYFRAVPRSSVRPEPAEPARKPSGCQARNLVLPPGPRNSVGGARWLPAPPPEPCHQATIPREQGPCCISQQGIQRRAWHRTFLQTGGSAVRDA